jgi:hypothetical protein
MPALLRTLPSRPSRKPGPTDRHRRVREDPEVSASAGDRVVGFRNACANSTLEVVGDQSAPIAQLRHCATALPLGRSNTAAEVWRWVELSQLVLISRSVVSARRGR